MKVNVVDQVTGDQTRSGKTYEPNEEELRREYKYAVAVQTLKSLREKGLISEGELNKLELHFRKLFSPHLAPLMPELT